MSTVVCKLHVVHLHNYSSIIQLLYSSCTCILVYCNAGGPFYISCGKQYKLYWRVTKYFNERNVIIVDRKHASAFSIEKTAVPDEFQIALYRGEDNASAYYVNLDKAKTPILGVEYIAGSQDGPLQIGGSSAANFTLRTADDKDMSIRDVNLWENTPRYIRVAPRSFQIRSYLALDNEAEFIKCVHSRRSEDNPNIFMRFKLERVPYEDRNNDGKLFGPTFGSVKPLDPIKCDGTEFNFEYEFDPVPDSEEYIDAD